jgi:hypothetical protein
MKKSDTLDVSPSPLLVRTQDLENYKNHRQKLQDMKPVNKISNGEHIYRINDNCTRFLENQRQRSIEVHNQLLHDRI